MASSYPGSFDTFVYPTDTEYLNDPDLPTLLANLNDAILAVEVTVGVNSSVDPSSLNYLVNSPLTGDVTTVGKAATLGGTANVEGLMRANRLDQMAAPVGAVSLGNQKIVNLANGTYPTDAATMQDLVAQWVSDTNPWTWVATGTGTVGNQFSMPDAYGFLALIYPKGLKLQWTDSGGTKFGVLASTSYNSSTHITTFTMVPTTDYTMANSTISGAQYSMGSPVPFPNAFAWSPQVTGATGAGFGGWWSIESGMCRVCFSTLFIGTGSDSTFGMTAPIVSNATGSLGSTCAVVAMDAGTSVVATATISPGSTAINVINGMYYYGTTAVWTASGNRGAHYLLNYPL